MLKRTHDKVDSPAQHAAAAAQGAQDEQVASQEEGVSALKRARVGSPSQEARAASSAGYESLEEPPAASSAAASSTVQFNIRSESVNRAMEQPQAFPTPPADSQISAQTRLEETARELSGSGRIPDLNVMKDAAEHLQHITLDMEQSFERGRIGLLMTDDVIPDVVRHQHRQASRELRTALKEINTESGGIQRELNTLRNISFHLSELVTLTGEVCIESEELFYNPGRLVSDPQGTTQQVVAMCKKMDRVSQANAKILTQLHEIQNRYNRLNELRASLEGRFAPFGQEIQAECIGMMVNHFDHYIAATNGLHAFYHRFDRFLNSYRRLVETWRNDHFFTVGGMNPEAAAISQRLKGLVTEQLDRARYVHGRYSVEAEEFGDMNLPEELDSDAEMDFDEDMGSEEEL